MAKEFVNTHGYIEYRISKFTGNVENGLCFFSHIHRAPTHFSSFICLLLLMLLLLSLLFFNVLVRGRYRFFFLLCFSPHTRFLSQFINLSLCNVYGREKTPAYKYITTVECMKAGSKWIFWCENHFKMKLILIHSLTNTKSYR